MEGIEVALAVDRSLASAALARLVEEKYRVHVHPRSIQRALVRRKGKRR
jgi:hypothetical protein